MQYRNYIYIVTILGYLLLCINYGFSQSKSDTITSKTHALNAVHVNASRVKHEVNSSSPVQHISLEQHVDIRGITDIGDALRRLSGVNIKDYGGLGGMKTVSVRNMGANHTGVNYDGLPLSNTQTGQIDMSRFSIDQLSGISLTMGDNDDIFRSARSMASVALLDLYSMHPTFKDKSYQLKGRITGGSFGLIGADLNYAKQIKDNSYFSLLGSALRADNEYPFIWENGSLKTKEHRFDNQMERYHTEFNLHLKKGASVWDGKVYYYDAFHRLPGPVIFYNTGKGHNRERTNERNFFSQMKYGYSWSEKWSLKAAGKFNWAYLHYRDYGNQYPNGVLSNPYYQREYYLTFAMLYLPTAHWALSWATDYIFNDLAFRNNEVKKPYRHGLLQSLNVRYKTSRIILTGSLLGAYYKNGTKYGPSAKNGKRISPSISFSWKLMQHESLFLRLFYKDIYRMPTFSENYFTTYSVRNLTPEIARQCNIGVTYEKNFGEKANVSVTADAYYNRVTDKIIAVPLSPVYWQMYNMGEVRITGLDVNVKSDISIMKRHKLLADASGTLQKAIDVSFPNSETYKNYLPYSPLFSGSFSLGWENPWLNCSIHGTGASLRYNFSNNRLGYKLPAYADMGLALYHTFQWRGKDIHVRLDCENLFDTQYSIIRSYPMPGRHYKLSILFTL